MTSGHLGNYTTLTDVTEPGGPRTIQVLPRKVVRPMARLDAISRVDKP
jgi:hypothetical protein